MSFDPRVVSARIVGYHSLGAIYVGGEVVPVEDNGQHIVEALRAVLAPELQAAYERGGADAKPRVVAASDEVVLRALHALRLEVPEPVADGVTSIVSEVLRDRAALREARDKAEKQRAAAQESVCRYVNAQGPHMAPSWKQVFIDACRLEVDTGNPYLPVRPAKEPR